MNTENFKLAIVIVAFNEEDVIKEAILSCRDISDKILLVDSVSSDSTREIAKKLGVEVLIHTFKDFSDQRNYAIDNVDTDWVLYLDADERLTEEFKKELKNIISNYDLKDDIGGYYIRRKTFYYGKDWGFTDRVQRLFFREKFVEWYGVVHETPKIHGKFGNISSPILHFTHRNLTQMVSKTNKWSEYESSLRFRADHPEMSVLRFIKIIFEAFFASYIKQRGIKNGTKGLIEAIYQSFSMFITYAKLWEKQRLKKK